MELVKCIRYSIYLSQIAIGFFGIYTRNLEWMLASVTLLWVCNIIFALENWKERFMFFWFHCMIFMFLICRPLISIFKGYTWKYYTDEAMRFTFFSLWLTMVAMQIGAIMYEEYKKAKSKRTRPISNLQTKQKWFQSEEFRKSIQIVSLIIYAVAFVSYFYLQMEKFLFMRGKIYYEFYTNFESSVPYIVHVLASFRIYSLGIFLATRPKKKIAFVVLALFLFSDIPVLLYGKRSLILTDALFILIYYILRDGMGEKGKWLGRIEKMCIFIGGPLVILLMGALNYIRDGISVSGNITNLFLDFLYKQGVSFNVMNLAYESIPFLPERPFRNYTFGGIIDYFAHGSFAQKFFGAKAFASGNNLEWALESNSFAHNMSYIAADDYLDGHGLGSSYILEVFTDYGYVGLIVFSILLGVAMIWFVHIMRKMNFASMLVLIITMNIFFMPRGEATGAVSFLFYAQFWAVVFVCYCGAALIARLYSYQSVKKNKNRREKQCLNILE